MVQATQARQIQTAHTGHAIAIGENCTANTYVIQQTNAADEHLFSLLLAAEAKNTRLIEMLLQAQEENTRLRLALAGANITTNNG